MLSRHRRLRAAEVREVLAQGNSVRAGQLSAKFICSKEPSRVAVVVPKSIARRATRRNRLRRVLYQTLRPLLPDQGIRMVLLLRVPLRTKDTATLSHDLKTLFRSVIEKNV